MSFRKKKNKPNFRERLSVYEALLKTLKEEIKDHYFIKEASKLLMLKFDVVVGFTFDYKHTVLLGVTRKFTSHWMDSKNHSKPFYIGKNLKKVDSLWLKF